MSRRFNTAGPNDPARHHTIPALSRIPGVRDIIEQGSYFILHAPRQMGKTTALLDLAAAVNQDGNNIAAVLSLEPGAAMGSVDAAELAMLDSWRYDLAAYLPADVAVPRWPDAPPGNRIGAALSAFAQQAPRPLVILLDGLDALAREVRASLVRQLRAGKPRRPRGFPWCIGFASLRDPREFDTQGPSSQSSPASSRGLEGEVIQLPPLSRAHVGKLLTALQERTGDEVLPGAIDRAYELTQGTPFLVNALAQRLAEAHETRKGPITAVEVERARDTLLDRRGGLIDEVAERMRDPKLKTLLEQIAVGNSKDRDLDQEELRLAMDLGVVKQNADGRYVVANPVWLGLIGRLMPNSVRSVFPQGQPTWVLPDGRLDPDKLLDEFVDFWRKQGDSLFSSAPYGELSPLVLTAFLNRVIRSGGLIEREYALGRGRMDVCIRQGGVSLALVVKVRRDRDADPCGEGLVQIDDALTRLGIERGWLIIFDRRNGLSPVSQRLAVSKEKTPKGREVVLVRA